MSASVSEFVIRNGDSFRPVFRQGVMRVRTGTINLYVTRFRHQQPDGVRHFLFQVEPGELIYPVADFHGEDDLVAGLLAVPVRDGKVEILSREALNESPVREKAYQWVERCCNYLKMDDRTRARYRNNTGPDGMDLFNAGLARLLYRSAEAARKAAEQQSARRQRTETAYLEASMDNLAGVLPRGLRKMWQSRDPAAREHPLFAACKAVASSQGIELQMPDAMRDGEELADPISEIATASRIRVRKVLLRDNWHRETGGSFLGYLNELASGGRIRKSPVAILQSSSGRYVLQNPRTGGSVKVSGSLAARIAPEAYMFYRSLPSEPQRPRDVFRFVLDGVSKSDLLWIVLMGVGGGLLSILTPQITGQVFDSVIPVGNRELMGQIGILMVALALTRSIFELTRAFAMHRISAVTEKDLQSAVWDRLIALPTRFFRGHTAGELTSRAMGISQIRSIVEGSVVNTVMAAIFSLFYIILLFVKSPKLAWIGLAVLAVSTALSLLMGWLQLKYEGEHVELSNRISGKLFGWFSGLSKIKLSGSERRVYWNWSGLFTRSRRITFRKETIANRNDVIQSMTPLVSSILLFLAMYRMGGDMLTPGAFIAFTVALDSLAGAGQDLTSTFLSANVVIPLYRNIQPIFTERPEYDEGKDNPGILSGEIALQNVTFRYQEGGPPVLDNVSIRIQPGEHVALVGTSGSGKTTLVRVLLGFEKPESGDVLYDNRSLSQMDVRMVRRQLGVVLQSGQLTPGTIYENIIGANLNLSREQAMRAAEIAGLAEDIREMPMGMETALGDRAATLSGGQRQRLMIARAVASGPRILFFDEATSALDNTVQQEVSDNINRLRATRLTIAHRLSTIQECDRILLLQNGKIAEQGTFQELMRQDGAFAALARRQLLERA